MTRIGIRRLLPLLVLAIVLTVVVRPVDAAATNGTSNQTVHVDFTAFNPCAAGGVGEDVQLSGDMHYLFSYTNSASPNGRFVVHFRLNLWPTYDFHVHQMDQDTITIAHPLTAKQGAQLRAALASIVGANIQ